jgi:ankyrin repeat protein
VVRLLVEHKAAVDARSNSRKLLFNTSGPGSNLLAGAKEKGGAPKVIPVGGSTPLLFAARSGCIECARILLAHGANKDDSAPDGTSALVLAAHSGQGSFAAFLLDAGANPNAEGAGYAALHAAVLKDDLTLIKALLAHGANPNLQLASGTPVRRGGPDFGFPAYLIGATPFLLAAKYASPEMMRVLAAGGADLRLATGDGTTAIIAAAGADHRTGGPPGTPPAEEPDALAAVAAALELGCDVNAANQAGNSALHIAALRGYNTIVKLLLEHGARTDIKNKRGQTPLSITPGEFKSTADLLRKAGETQ